MLKRHHLIFHWSIATMDLVLVALAGVAAWWPWLRASLRGAPSRAPIVTTGDLVALAILCLAWVSISAQSNLYRSRRTESIASESWLIVRNWVLAFALAELVRSVSARYIGTGPESLSLLAIGLAPAAMILVRIPLRLFLGTIRVRGGNFRRALIVGDGRSARAIERSLVENPHFGVRVVGVAPFPSELRNREQRDVPLPSDPRTADQWLTEEHVDFVAVCPSPEATGEEIEGIFQRCDEAGIQCLLAPAFLDLNHLVPAVAHIGRVPVLSFSTPRSTMPARAIKRAMDLVISTAALLVFAPVLPILALLIRLHDGGPALFTQTRVGRNGKHFRLYKFRTMAVDAEVRRGQLERLNEVDGPVFKIRRDPRITPIGRFLRKYSLDELPQLFNVLRGEMSIVGPRPPIPEEVRKYAWWQRRRLSVKPGLTCIWQVHGRNQVSFERWIMMDLAYIDRMSPLLDLKLMLQTIRAVVRGTGC